MAEKGNTGTLEDFSRWKVTVLKDYLKSVGLNTQVSKETLVARAMVANELNLPKVLTKDEYSKSLKEDIAAILQTPKG